MIDTTNWEYVCNVYNLNRIRHRCEVSVYMGDAGVDPMYDHYSDEELFKEYKWLLDERHEILDKIYIQIKAEVK